MDPKFPTYSAFGLSISSEIEIPELLPSTRPPDLCYRYGYIDLPRPPEDSSGPFRGVKPTEHGVLLYWSRIGAFLVHRGETVTVSPASHAAKGLIRVVLTGPVLALALMQRELPVFHSSVLSTPDHQSAVAIMARSGGGKSTLAAALCRAGFLMMSDDIMPVVWENGSPLVVPGFPYAKLKDDAARALYGCVDEPDTLAPDFDKRSRSVRNTFARRPAPLRAVFILDLGPSTASARLSGFDAVGAAMPHWYGAGFDGQLISAVPRARQLPECAELAKAVAVYRLTRPWSLDRLDESVSEIRQAMEQFTS